MLAAAIQALTGYFTETNRRPVQDIGKSSQTGAATVVLAGISVGLESAVYSALLIGAGVYGAFLLGGSSITLSLFAVALAGTGLLTTVGVIVAMDTFGPISDNAQGIAEMSGDIDEKGARILTELDAVGNTTKAITKGIAIATAVLAATALFGSYTNTPGQLAGRRRHQRRQVQSEILGLLNISNPRNLVGLLIGAAVVFLFSGLAINAVSRSAGAVVMEVRRQFREFPGIMDRTERPEYGRVVDICTRDAQRELLTPGLLAIMAPIAVGFGLGAGALAAYLAGAIGTGTLMAVFLANSGGAWDNAKKLVEDGAYGGKGSEAHAATVIGDTVGDPFKDTAGPAINPLLKVMNLVSLLIAPAVVSWSIGKDANTAAAGHHRGGGGGDHRGRGRLEQAQADLDGRRRSGRRPATPRRASGSAPDQGRRRGGHPAHAGCPPPCDGGCRSPARTLLPMRPARPLALLLVLALAVPARRPAPARPDARAWAAQVCTTLSPWRTEIGSLTTRTQQQMTAETTPGQAKENLMTPLRRRARTRASGPGPAWPKAGVPDVTDGQQIADRLRRFAGRDARRLRPGPHRHRQRSPPPRPRPSTPRSARSSTSSTRITRRAVWTPASSTRPSSKTAFDEVPECRDVTPMTDERAGR